MIFSAFLSWLLLGAVLFPFGWFMNPEFRREIEAQRQSSTRQEFIISVTFATALMIVLWPIWFLHEH